jgi:hypothetical protein
VTSGLSGPGRWLPPAISRIGFRRYPIGRFGISESELIPECAGMVGTAYLIDRMMSDEYRVLTR